MNCDQCQGIEREFGQSEAASKLRAYREHGPAETTRLLIEAVKASGVAGQTVLDIGGGIGALQYGLLEAGAQSATSVEASSAYLRAAQDEAQRQGVIDRIHYAHGNFVELAAEIPAADIVTLDRVICCYHDMPALVGLSAARARKVYGLVYPREAWWVRLGIWLENLVYRLQGSSFRAFVHASQAVEAILHEQGWRRRYHRQNLAWQVAVYTRT
jgi:magnesium-protoporphyrin O-methyltransferase